MFEKGYSSKIEIICQLCKKKFKVHPYRIKTVKYCSYKCRGQANQGQCHSTKTQFKKGQAPYNKGKEGLSGNKNPSWKGGKVKSSMGYIWIYYPTHPFCNDSNYVFEHRLIMEKHIGRYLQPEEIVHHINGIKDDNRIENFILFANNSEHCKHHFPNGCNLKRQIK